MNPSDFIASIVEITEFERATDISKHTDIPEDWYVLVADIVDSTKAIENGQYKSVNSLGATVIVSILNINRDLRIPYIFGGDGATLVIPESMVEKSKNS